MNDFTIVVATIVRPTLFRLLASINSSTLKPKKVIISIPPQNNISLKDIYSFEIQIISKAKGQVAQRNEGFKLVETSFCVQMDDDIIFNKYFLYELISSFSKLPINSSMSPGQVSQRNHPISSLVNPAPYFKKFMYYILDSNPFPRFGTITKSGVPLGINPCYEINNEDSLIETSWLPGGCAIHHSSNLIFNWTYPYLGKAYAEDILHSQLLRREGIKLFIERSINIVILDQENIMNIFQWLYTYFSARIISYKALSFIPEIKRNQFRYTLFTIFYLLDRLIFLLNIKLKKSG